MYDVLAFPPGLTHPGAMEEGTKPSKSRLGRTISLAKLATDTSARVALGMAKRAVGEDVRAHHDHDGAPARDVRGVPSHEIGE